MVGTFQPAHMFHGGLRSFAGYLHFLPSAEAVPGGHCTHELRTRCEPGLQPGSAVGFGAVDLAHTATFACRCQNDRNG